MAANSPKGVKSLIWDALRDLTEQEFTEFTHYLRERKGEPQIRRNDVYNKKREDIADLLVCFYTEEGALSVAVETLKQARFIRQAKELAAGGEFSVPPPSDPPSASSGSSGTAGGESSAPPPSNPPSASSGSSGTSGKHFVDEHRLDLIRRVSNIDPILDELLDQDVIKQETYDRIIKLAITQDKVRELYNGPLKAGEASKEKFYKSLMDNEQYLIDDLKKKKK